jgi:hypothetical protein
MRYLHGDSSPFPVNENFLETLCAATDACVGVFQADLAVEKARSVKVSSDLAVAAEVERVERLHRAVLRALAPHGPSEEQADAANATEAAALKIAELTRGALDDTRVSIERWRERAVATALAAVPDVTKIVAAFLVKHSLPATHWTFEWHAPTRTAPGRAVVHSMTDAGLDASFEVALPSGHLWSTAVKGSVVEPTMTIPLLKKGWFNKSKLAKERLDRLFITDVRHAADATTITLRKSRRDPSPGIELTVRSDAAPGVSAVRIDPAGSPIDERATLTGDAALVVQRLWERVEATLSDVVYYRKRMLSATLDGIALAKLEQPGDIGTAIIRSVAPIVAGMLRHSRSRGELTLKRDLGDGRREELFIAHEQVTRRWDNLPPQYQARFDIFDLEDGRTNVLSRGDVSGYRPTARMARLDSEPELLSA